MFSVLGTRVKVLVLFVDPAVTQRIHFSTGNRLAAVTSRRAITAS